MPLALKYRPQKWEDLIGQETTVKILKELVRRRKEFPLLVLSGSRGLGKTTSARILAKAVNCVEPEDGEPCNACKMCRAIDGGSCPDIIELDAASNGGIDSVREIRNLSQYRPIMASYRVIILDEAHAMSKAASQAFLKLLEEPPPSTIFVMATTDVGSIPDTILSRAFAFEYKRVPAAKIALLLEKVSKLEGIAYSDGALEVIASGVRGGVRDALTILEQTATLGEVTPERVREVTGALSQDEFFRFLDHLTSGTALDLILWLDQVEESGIEPGVLVSSLVDFFSDLLRAYFGTNPGASASDYSRMITQSRKIGKESILRIMRSLIELADQIARVEVSEILQIQTAMCTWQKEIFNVDDTGG